MNLDTRNDVSEVLARICIDSCQVSYLATDVVDNDISWSLVVGRDFLLYILYHGMKPNDEASKLDEAKANVDELIKDESYEKLIELSKHKYHDLWEQICNRQDEGHEEHSDIEGEVKMLSELDDNDTEYSYKTESSNHSTKVDKMKCVLLDSGANVHVIYF